MIFFVLSDMLRIILNIEEFITLDEYNSVKDKGCHWVTYWTILAAPISHIILSINSSINIFIYCYFNKTFREIIVTKWIEILNLLRTRHEHDSAISGIKDIEAPCFEQVKFPEDEIENGIGNGDENDIAMVEIT